jgi:hypothetical protein
MGGLVRAQHVCMHIHTESTLDFPPGLLEPHAPCTMKMFFSEGEAAWSVGMMSSLS